MDDERSLACIIMQNATQDGKCVFCNYWAQLALRFESSPDLLFANLQSDAGMRLSRAHNLPVADWDSFVIVNKGRAYTKWRASNELFIILGGVFYFLGTFLNAVVPLAVGNALYSFGWRHRKRLFGSSETCMVPSAALKARILA